LIKATAQQKYAATPWFGLSWAGRLFGKPFSSSQKNVTIRVDVKNMVIDERLDVFSNGKEEDERATPSSP
jgi:hypothetical protein